jgi:divalent metal cation (Fe/Co/Zn/Cd) transporter
MDRLYKQALFLSLFTILYNIAEGLVSMFFGYQDETLSLFGFGIDSFIEVISGLGILIMVQRIRKNKGDVAAGSEVMALKITGYSFYALSLGLLAGGIISIIQHHTPVTTLWGVIIALASIVVMLWLYLSKIRTGKKLDSDAIIADANCTKVCIYMSVVLLAASLVYELTGFAYADVIGAAGLIWFSFSEGHEALEKAEEAAIGDE